MNAVVGYHSRNGHTQRMAQAIAADLTGRGANATLLPVDKLTAADVDAADVVFLGTWAQGLIEVRVRPAGIRAWLPTLPDLTGKRTATFATYRFRAADLMAKLGDELASKGAQIVASQASQRDRLDTGVREFVDRALAASGASAA